MESSELRKPTQKRAVEKKNKIIKYGFELICKNGFHNTDSAQIAKYAGVSTGTVYQYFTDKKDIFLQGLKIYAEDLMFPINEIKDKKINKEHLPNELKNIIQSSVKTHKISESAHEEIIAMQHTNEEVAAIFKDQELKATNNLVQVLKENNIVVDNIYERAHLILKWIDDLCHEIAFHKHKNMDYDKMTDLVISSIVNLLN